MNQYLRHMAAALFTFGGVVGLSSCTSEPKPLPSAASPQYEASVTTKPGVAGGMFQHKTTVQAIVSAVDLPYRHVTLTGPNGNAITFSAGEEIQNLSQVHVGDRVNATFMHQIVITVQSDASPPSAAGAVAMGAAPKGEKPGVMVAEHSQTVGQITAIDSVHRTADLEFTDGTINGVPVRPDVDLSRYKVGDNVVIQETTALTALVEKS